MQHLATTVDMAYYAEILLGSTLLFASQIWDVAQDADLCKARERYKLIRVLGRYRRLFNSFHQSGIWTPDPRFFDTQYTPSTLESL